MRNTRPNSRKTAGLGLVELLLSLTIASMLLTSVAIAFHASLETFDENGKVASVTHSSRVLLHRMMTEARCADAVECESNRIAIIPPDDGSCTTMVQYVLTNGTLWYRVTAGGIERVYPLLSPDTDNVTINSFNVTSETDIDENGQIYTISITAQLDLEVDGNCFAVTASTNPRQNMAW